MTKKPKYKTYDRLLVTLIKIVDQARHGTRLPSEPQLSKKLGVSRATLREALRMLESQGRILRIQGSGTYVTAHSTRMELGLDVLQSLNQAARPFGIPLVLGKWDRIIRPSIVGEEKIFGLGKYSKLMEVTRIMELDNHPTSYLVDIFPSNLVNPNRFDDEFQGSVLDLLNSKPGINITKSNAEITAVRADQIIAQRLLMKAGFPLLLFKSVLYNYDKKPLVVSLGFHNPSYFKFTIERESSEIENKVISTNDQNNTQFNSGGKK